MAYGQPAGSLEELQNQVSKETGYRAQLEDYAASHNLTLSYGTPYTKSTETLEKIVKAHMEGCLSGSTSGIAEGTADTSFSFLGDVEYSGHC